MKRLVEFVFHVVLILTFLINAILPSVDVLASEQHITTPAKSPEIDSNQREKEDDLNTTQSWGIDRGEHKSQTFKHSEFKQSGLGAENSSFLSLTISSTYYADSVRTKLTQNASEKTLYVANSSGFVVGDEILVISMKGTQVGQYETGYVDQVLTNQLELTSNLAHTYNTTTGTIMVQKVPHFGDVTVTSTGILTAHAWDGEIGGIVFLRANSITVASGGRIDVSGLGYRGGEVAPNNTSNPSPGEGPGGGQAGISYYYDGTGGGGGSYGTSGYTGHQGSNCAGCWNVPGSLPGNIYGNITLDNLYMGSGGGGGGRNTNNLKPGKAGQSGGGIIFIYAQSIDVNGQILANGSTAIAKSSCYGWDEGSGGAGAGGSIYLKGLTINIASSASVTAIGGFGNTTTSNCWYGGQGGNGIIFSEIITSEPVDPNRSIINVSPDFVSANGTQTATILVTLRDAHDNPIMGHQVAINHNGVNLTISPTTGQSDDQGLVTFTISSSTVQIITLQARDLTSEVSLSSTPTLEFVKTDPDQSTISVVPGWVTADGTSEATISVTLKDSLGNTLAEKPVELLISGTSNYIDGRPVGPLKITVGNTDENGTVLVKLSSPHAETKTISAFGQQIALSLPTQVVFKPGAVSPTASSFSIAPLSVVADGRLSADVTLILKDAQGNPIPDHVISLMTSNNPVQVEMPQQAKTDLDGTLTAKITSTTLGTTTVTAKDQTEDIIIGQSIVIEFVAGSVDAEISSVEVQGEPLVANGSDMAEIRVILMDSLGHPISGHDVSLTASGSGNTISASIPSITGSDGTIRFTLKSTRAEAKIVTIRDTTQNITLSDEPVVIFAPGPVNLQKSRMETDVNIVAADGETPATITVTVQDEFDNPILGVPVTIVANGHAFVTQPANPTDENGQASGQVKDATIERVTVTAKANGAVLPGTIFLEFKGLDLVAQLSGTAQAAPEGKVSYSILVKNSGNLPANQAVLKISLPTGLILFNHTATSEPVQQDTQLIWNLGVIEPGGRIAFDVIANVDSNAVPGTVLTTLLEVTTSSLEAITNNNSANAATAVIPAYSFTTSLTPSSAILNQGGSTSYNLHVVNSGQKANVFEFSVSGLDSSWVTFTPNSVALTPGAAANVEMKVSVASCQSGQTFPFTVIVNPQDGGEPVDLNGELNLDAKPQIMIDAPAENSLSGSTSVLFSWRTKPNTSGSLSVYPSGYPDQARTFTTIDGTAHSVQVAGLTRNIPYEWNVTADSECGSQTVTQHFSVGNGIVFTHHTQNITIDRDYNQLVQIDVRNEDLSAPHTLTTSILSSYEDLIVNFVNSGSIDQTIELQPGETKQVTLAIHAQDTKLFNYELTAHLVADIDSTKIIDNAVLKVHILSDGNYTIVEDISAFDPVTLAQTYVITNSPDGKPITDLSLTAVDPVTGLSANILLQPSLEHARLGTGESIRVVAYPIFTAENLVGSKGTSQAFINASSLQTVSFGLNKSNQQNNVSAINYTLKGLGAGVPVEVSGSTSCPAGKQIYAVTISKCEMAFNTNDWYCTNRPNITTALNVPAFLNQSSIGSITMGLAFAPNGNVLPHSGKVNFNGQEVGSFTNSVPNGEYKFPVPASAWNSALAGLVTQNIQLSTQHANGGHYVSSTGYHLNVYVNNATTYACAASQEAAQQVIQQTYACNAPGASNPWTDILNRSVWNWGEIKKQLKKYVGDLGYVISPISCTQGDCGDPINPRTGVFSFASPDLSFPTSAGNLVFQRAYSSGTTEAYTDALGHGWTYNHDTRLIFPDDPGGMEGFVLFKDVIGNQYLFGIQADGSYKPGPGVLATLTKSTTTPTEYTLTAPEQSKYEFDETGHVTSRTDAQGHSFTYIYDSGKLTRVSADQGDRYIDLGYDEQDRIISVKDHAGEQVSYTYDSAGDLISSTDVLGRVWHYAYDSGHRMNQMIDPSGKDTVTTEYDMNGRAYRQFDGNGKLMVRIIYNADGSSTVYDAKGNVKTHKSNEHNLATEKVDELNHKTNTSYDANFRPTTITNAAGQTLTMEWSADGKNLLSKTDPAGGRTVNTYDEFNNLTSSTDPLGNETTYTYTGKLLTSKTNALHQTTTYTYTPEGYLKSETDVLGNKTSYTYDSHGQRISTCSGGTATRPCTTTSFAYDDKGHLLETVDERGRVTHNEYDAGGQLLRTISNYDPTRLQNAENQYNITTIYTYDVRGNQTSVTDTYGHITLYEYDGADRLLSTTDPAGNVTTNTYDDSGLLAATTDALGNTTSYVYDATGRRLSTIDALGHSSGTTIFNIAANTSTATDAMGHSATYYYDEMNRVVKVVDSLGNFTTSTYDDNGNVATRTDQLGRTTHFEYDELNRLVHTTDPLNGVTSTVYDQATGNRITSIDPLGHSTGYTYNDAGLLTVTTDPLGHNTSNIYDAEGRLISTTDPLGRTTHTEYDEWGRRTTTVDAIGGRTTYTYDALDRVVSTTEPTGITTTRYDALGNVVARTDIQGRSSTNTYDEMGRVVTSIDFDGNTTTNLYDAVGNLHSSINAQGTTTYTYDKLNRRIATTDTLGNTTHQAFDVLGNLTDETDANGVVTHYVYDVLNRKVAVIQNYQPGVQANADTNVRIDYTYNEVGNRIKVTNANQHETRFEYDELNRVIKKIDPLGNTWQYEYDMASSRIAMTDGNGKTTHFGYDADRQLTLIDYPAPETDVSFTYDVAGQRITMTDGMGTTAWAYDELGRLTSVTDPNNKTVSYTYDAAGNRIGLDYPDDKSVSYTYDSANRLKDVADWSDKSTEYNYDTLGRLLSILRPNGVNSSYIYDDAGHLSQVEHSTQSTPLASYQYEYDPAGNRIHAMESVQLPETPSTPTPTVTATMTVTQTPTSTETPTVTGTSTSTVTATQTVTMTETPTATVTKTVTPTASATIPASFTETPTLTQTATMTATPSNGTYVVTKTQDTQDGVCNSDCSLREALIAANTSPGANIIVLPAGTYTLSISGSDNTSAAGDLDITDAVTISGSGIASTVISGGTGWSDRILDVLSTTVSLENLTVQNGSKTNNTGAGIQTANSTLTLSGVILKNNHASSGGAGIYQSGGSVTITNSAIVDNIVDGSGGGIYNDNGSLSLSNVTLSGNSAKTDGGAIFQNSSSGTLSLVNVTISNNTADSDDNNAGDGGGLYRSAGTVTLKNVILAGNMDGSTSTIRPDCYGTIQSQGHNLIGSNNCTFTPGSGDLVGTSGSPINALLEALADNGGDTLTQALQASSLAINAGDNSGCPAADQRGYNRDTGCDMGAFEFIGTPAPTYTPVPIATSTITNTPTITATPAPPNTPTVTSTATVTATPSNGTYVVTKTQDTQDGVCNSDCSLREALIAANTSPGANIIVLPAGTYILSISGSDNTSAAGDLDLTDAVTISGNGTTSTVISGGTGWSDRILDVLSATANLENLTIQNGSMSSNNGAGIKSTNSTLTLSGVILKNNHASGGGAGIYQSGGILTITNSAIVDNIADVSGGGIYNYNGSLSLSNVTLSGNSAKTDGGAIFQNSSSGTLSLVNVTISNNTADSDDNNAGDGGGLYRSAGTVTLKNVILAGNMDGSTSTIRPDCYGTIQSQGHNLIGSNNCTFTPGSGDLVGTSGSPVNALLEVLADNGGDTLTQALQASSPAINAGDNSGCPAADQRGYNRDAGCDMGAYEAGATAFLFQSNISFVKYNLPPALGLISDAPVSLPERATTAGIATTVSIDYTYDHLNRLTDATYTNGTAFHYTYDPAGNVLVYTFTISGQTTTISYTYDEANQLLTASQNGVTWHYTYDDNGSLVQSTPGESLSSGAKRYTYNTAGFLLAVETYTSIWQPQAEMVYDGLGNRLAMTGHAGGQSVTTQYELDNGQVLDATSGDLTTTYLYGLGPIAELTDTWSYSLPDGTNTQRQMTDISGEVTLTSSYTPWGDTLSIHGTGSFTQGYLGGIMDTATGLLYVGNGQYYDPETGRFLNRNAKPEQTNPYVPWGGNPSSALIGPLALLALVFGRKKKRSKWDNIIIVFVLCIAVGMSLAGCGPNPMPIKTPTAIATGTVTPTSTGTVEVAATITPLIPNDPGAGTATPIVCTATLLPTPSSSMYVNLSAYYMAIATGGSERSFGVPIKKTHTAINDTYWAIDLSETGKGRNTLKTDSNFLYDPKNGICMQGTGKLTNLNLYVYCGWPAIWEVGDQPDYVTFSVSPTLYPKVETFKTVARCPTSPRFRDGERLKIPLLKDIIGNDVFTIRSVGGELCNSDSLDVYIGEGRGNLENGIYAQIIGEDNAPFEYLDRP